jgi:NAD+ synthase (glutamine-hydrolysing)
MLLAIAQIDTTVGDVQGNTLRALQAVGEAEAAGATMTLLPEMTLTGYPPEDLVHKDHFVEENLLALEQVAGACQHLAVVGFVDRAGDDLYNAAALCGNSRVLKVYHKRNLPNYGVFDERRYFEPGAHEGLFELGGEMFAITVCEDVWVDEPVAEAADAGARLVVNVSASPYHAGKGAEREGMLRQRAREHGVWLAYANLVGGQDELVFDGRSVVISPTGEVVARAATFAEDLLLCEFSPQGKLGAPGRSEEPPGPDAEVYRALELGLADYVRKNGFTDVVIGLSGGIDSTLTAAVAADALGPEHVHGVMMPSRYSSEGSVTDAEALAENLGIDTLEIPIEGPFSAFLDALEPAFAGTAPDVTEENLQARVRGTLLMALSNKHGWLVLATGNKSELSVGYSTLYGDMVGGFAPLKDVFKTRVYDLARWRNRDGEVIPQACIDKAPSAELREDQLDADALPPYEVLDPVLEGYVERDLSCEAIAEQTGHDRELVDRVCHMVDAAEYKRRQGPMGIKITAKAFGRDRRMPVTNRYRG